MYIDGVNQNINQKFNQTKPNTIKLNRCSTKLDQLLNQTKSKICTIKSEFNQVQSETKQLSIKRSTMLNQKFNKLSNTFTNSIILLIMYPTNNSIIH